MLQVKRGGGQRPVKIGEAGLEGLQQKLQEDGFVDLKEAQRWLEERFGVHYSLSGVWYLIRIELGAKPKTGRVRNADQEPQEVEAFKKRGSRRWRIGRSGRKRGEDEARFGLKTRHKRRWMAPGPAPIGSGGKDTNGSTSMGRSNRYRDGASFGSCPILRRSR